MKLVHKLDGWFNVLTGLGRKNRDKRVHAAVEWTPLQEAEAEELYAADDIAAKLVDLLPAEALRAGYHWTGISKEDAERLDKALAAIGTNAAILTAWKYARIYGGCGLFLATEDLTDLAEPLPPNPIITGLRPIHRWELVADVESVTRDIRSPNYGNPTLYTLYPRMVDGRQMGEKIHYTRLIRFDGVPLPGRLHRENHYWGDSIFSRLFNALRNYHTEHDSAASIVQDFRVGKFKIKNLADMLAADQDQDIVKRLELVRLSKGICGAVVLDAEGEEFEYQTSSLAGLDALIAKAEMRLVAGARIPHTVLLGESPVGSNATGNSTVLNWYDYVDQERKAYLKDKLLHLARLKAAEIGVSIEQLDLEFHPLWQLDEKEQVNVRKLQADTDAIYLDRGVLDPSEVANSRFGGEKYSTETKLEPNARAALSAPATSVVEPTPLPINATLNSAQVESLINLVTQTAAGALSRESAKAILFRAFQLGPELAEMILGPAEFKPKTVEKTVNQQDSDTIGHALNAVGEGAFGPDGAKLAALTAVIEGYQAGRLSRESAMFLLMRAWNLSEQEAEQALGPPRNANASNPA